MSLTTYLPATGHLRLTPQQIAIATTAAMLAPILPTVAAVALDPRLLNGASLWLKPLHFQMSLAIHMATLALVMPWVSPSWQNARLLRWPLLAGAFSALLELFYMSYQAARGRASHFNDATPLEYTAYLLMGIGAVTIVAASGIVGFAVWRSMPAQRTSRLSQGIASGLILGSISTLIIGGYLGGLKGHLIGAVQSDAFGLPFLGWSTRSGDLRVPHFFATHAMQVLPLLGFVADWQGWRGGSWLMPALATIYLLAVVALFVQALAGQPLIPM